MRFTHSLTTLLSAFWICVVGEILYLVVGWGGPWRRPRRHGRWMGRGPSILEFAVLFRFVVMFASYMVELMCQGWVSLPNGQLPLTILAPGFLGHSENSIA